MAEQSPDAGVRLALFELQRYLSDELAPIMVRDSLELLLNRPPDVVASTVQGWVSAQYCGPGTNLPVSDYLFHSLKKIHLMSELSLLEQEPVARYLEDLGRIILALCPEEDRETLQANLNALGAVQNIASRVEIVHRQMRSGDAPPLTVEGSLAWRRYSLLVNRLQRDPRAGAGTAATSPDARGELLTQILATAAIQSRTGTELERRLEKLGELGVDAGISRVFRSLGRSLPGWALTPDAAGAAPASSTSNRTVDAMRRIIAMAGDEEEGTKRFGEMVEAAVEQFNEGSLVQAATMFDLAERIIMERKLTPEILKSIRKKGQESLSTDQLRRFAEKSDRHALLRKVLDFFPRLTVQGLLADLEEEPKRDRRKLMLALLEVHGAAARSAALGRLQTFVGGEMKTPQGYFQRNLLFLLRRIPRPAGAPLQKELDLLTNFSELTNPHLVVREAISALGQAKHERAEQVLTARLQEIEQLLTRGETRTHNAADLTLLLNRVVSALAGLGTPSAFRTIVDHSLTRKRALGDTMARLEVLAGQDLSGDRHLVARLVDSLRSEIPMRVLGFVVQQKQRNLGHLIQALSGTPAPAVREALEEIVQRFPDRDFATGASEVLASFGASSAPAQALAESLSGDVELFGLPNLLQTVAESRLTGILTLADREGQVVGTVSFEAGQIRGCRTENLRGEAAFYQLFEKPVRGTFTFQSQREGWTDKEGEKSLVEVVPMIVEAVRRHDEFKEARVLVPDDVRLTETRIKPTRPTTDEGTAFQQMVWRKVASGIPPGELEDALGVDAYRVRHLLAHWVEEGALQPR